MERFSDYTAKYFLASLVTIVLIGIVMVYSSSYLYAKEVMGSSVHFLLKHLIFVVVGTIFILIIGRSKFNFWFSIIEKIHILFLIMLVLTFVPNIGIELKGASRWLDLRFITIQPSEFVKYTIIMIAIKFFNGFFDFAIKERLKYMFYLLVPLLTLILQPDYGTFTISLLVISFVCFLSSFPRKYFYVLLGLGTVTGGALMFAADYRIQRLLTYLDPWKDAKRGGFQIIQSYYAFAHGALFGQGVGNSNEKLFYLPMAYNDFILSVLGEEFGFIGVLFVVMLFILFTYFGFKLALRAENRTISLFISTVIFTISLQALLNMGVVLGLLPTKGLNLPFISYGGSSILANFFGIGLLFSALNSIKSFSGKQQVANAPKKSFQIKAV